MTIWRKNIVFSIAKATNTHPQYVTVIAFPLQQWLHERASVPYAGTVHCLCCCTPDIQAVARQPTLPTACVQTVAARDYPRAFKHFNVR